MTKRRNRLSRGTHAVLSLALLALAGCATAPAPQSPARKADYRMQSVSEADGFTLKEEARLDGAVRADFYQAIGALEAGEIEKGIELLERVVKTSPNTTAPYINLAIAYAATGKLDRAEATLKLALELSPSHPVANNEYGRVLRKMGRFAEARSAYERVLEEYPNFQPARKNLGVLCDLYLRDLACALEHYRLYNAAVPDDKPVAIWIADLEKRIDKQ